MKDPWRRIFLNTCPRSSERSITWRRRRLNETSSSSSSSSSLSWSSSLVCRLFDSGQAKWFVACKWYNRYWQQTLLREREEKVSFLCIMLLSLHDLTHDSWFGRKINVFSSPFFFTIFLLSWNILTTSFWFKNSFKVVLKLYFINRCSDQSSTSFFLNGLLRMTTTAITTTTTTATTTTMMSWDRPWCCHVWNRG